MMLHGTLHCCMQHQFVEATEQARKDARVQKIVTSELIYWSKRMMGAQRSNEPLEIQGACRPSGAVVSLQQNAPAEFQNESELLFTNLIFPCIVDIKDCTNITFRHCWFLGQRVEVSRSKVVAFENCSFLDCNRPHSDPDDPTKGVNDSALNLEHSTVNLMNCLIDHAGWSGDDRNAPLHVGGAAKGCGGVDIVGGEHQAHPDGDHSSE